MNNVAVKFQNSPPKTFSYFHLNTAAMLCKVKMKICASILRNVH